MTTPAVGTPAPASDDTLPAWAIALRRRGGNSVVWWLPSQDLVDQRLSVHDTTSLLMPQVPIVNAKTHLLWFEDLHLTWRLVEPLNANYPKDTVSASFSFSVEVKEFSEWPSNPLEITELPMAGKCWHPEPSDGFFVAAEVSMPFFRIVLDEEALRYQVHFLGKGVRLI